ncbi:GNAT family N-acetyltransferase [Agromyces kandeliae]|uniref:GNAT family N-acetyltransferase n=1 Tax=Agromyces kandeliae TaxID=2666141 RepID=A0A6L5R5I4_9MICO|nr:GNAT family N-acetyltransferase [Agromyces kandeliae]MRX45145.1 GNAT family N-acetyltransferase [Agromyces kandeliae]
MGAEVREIRLSTATDATAPSELDAYAALIRRLDLERLGTDELARPVPELLREFADDPYRAHVPLGAFDGGTLVGMAELEWERDDDARTAYLVMLGVAPDRRRQDIGSALLAHAERVASDAGRPTLVLSADHGAGHGTDPADGTAPSPGGVLRAPQGDATIPADDPAVRFARAHGYALGQLDRVSVLDVAGRAAEFAARLADLAAPDPYRVRTWVDRAPDDLVDSLAVAHERMSVDAPSGAIAYELEHWDADRVRDEERRSLAKGRTTLTAAAVAPDGAVAGFTVLSLLADSPAVEQWDTIVLAAHRGHRLGMRLKLENLLLLQAADASRERVYTWNADENEHMLAINLDLGFRPFALESVWQRP